MYILLMCKVEKKGFVVRIATIIIIIPVDI